MVDLNTHSPSSIAATACLALAILHSFSVQLLHRVATRFPIGSARAKLFHLLSEVEVVFGIWAGLYLIYLASTQGLLEATRYLNSQNFTEPAFVFVIMTLCSTRPILNLAARSIDFTARAIPVNPALAFYVTTLIVGPLLGSFITEPAAMTVTALVLLDRFYSKQISTSLKYATLGLLFVNVSIGGVLTPYAAPPVLMIASKWGWGAEYMFTQFGWKAVIAVFISTVLITLRFAREIQKLPLSRSEKIGTPHPSWLSAVYLAFLIGMILSSHSSAVFGAIFLAFLSWTSLAKDRRKDLRLRSGFLVALFLSGLVVLGSPQRWWLEPILRDLHAFSLYLGAISLTAITDNASLTYLGSQVPNLANASKYALVAGSVVGGGLTVIANAPNPAGFGILRPAFGEQGISPVSLFAYALLPTAVAALCFWVL